MWPDSQELKHRAEAHFAEEGEFDAEVDRAVITGVEQERHYFASIEIEHDGECRTLSCRPSDAVALALRSYGAGIFAEESVLDDAGVLPDGSKPGRVLNPGNGAAPAVSREDELAEREAALAARERDLAEREAAIRLQSTGEAVAHVDPGPDAD